MKIKAFTKSFAIVAAICLFATSAIAQTPRQGREGREGRERMTAEQRAKSQTERLEKDLTLTAAQKTKIEAVNLDYAKKADKIMESSRGEAGNLREKLQEQSSARDAKYKEILTADQYAKYLKSNEERRRRNGTRGGGQNQAPKEGEKKQ